MYIIIAPVQIKTGHRTEFIDGMRGHAQGFANDEPGCVRFDVIQDADDPNRIWLYEVFKDEAAFQQHVQSPRLIKWLETSQVWRDQGQGPQGATRGSLNIWPPDDQWK